jgi:Tol biopolymer transport system component/DNA-binding winged helix-turn-helix (wHTH) protein
MGEDPTLATSRDVTPASNKQVRFGIYEVDIRAGELRKGGLKIKLHGRPFAVLAMLLERPGEVVTREELQQQLWASDTFVDFEHGLNKAINKLREALGDDANNPRYIETLPRRGYRFVCPITQPAAVPGVTVEEEKKGGASQKTSRQKAWAVGFGGAIVCVLLGAAFLWFRSSTRPPRVLTYRQLTTDRQHKGLNFCGNGFSSKLVTDGPRVFFAVPTSSVAQVPASGGEVVTVSSPFACFLFSDISPDKTELLGTGTDPVNGYPIDQPLWSLSVANGQARRLGNLTGYHPVWSSDGQRIAYASAKDILGPGEVYIAAKDGSSARRLVRFEKSMVWPMSWSPAGNVLSLGVWERPRPCTSLWEVSADGTNLHRLTPFAGEENCEVVGQSWSPDGRYSILTIADPYLRRADIWLIRETQSAFLSRAAKPVQLTSGAMNFWNAVPSPDGKQIFAIGGQHLGELVRYDSSARRLEPMLSGISAEHLDFSRDGKWVTYVSFPEGSLWRSKVDGSNRMQLTTPPLGAVLPRWSPDGTRIAFTGQVSGGFYKIYVVSAEGGKPEVVSEEQADEVDPTWSPDGNSLIFGPSQWSAHQISSLDLRTGHVSAIPGSKGLFTPRMSPDGRFIVAGDTPGNRKLLLFDQQTQKWSELLDSSLTGATSPSGWPQWSGDSKYVYVGAKTGTQGYSVYRVAIADHKLERVARFEVPEGTIGVWGPWFGVTPDGSPLLLRDLSIDEIYALDVDLP